MTPPPLDLDLLIKLGGLLVAFAMGWATLRAQAKRNEERADEQQRSLTSAVSTWRDESVANRQLAQEALRQAQAAHTRVDNVVLQQQALEVSHARLDERVSLSRMRSTARVRPEETPE